VKNRPRGRLDSDDVEHETVSMPLHRSGDVDRRHAIPRIDR
jgi:hypothetical protein